MVPGESPLRKRIAWSAGAQAAGGVCGTHTAAAEGGREKIATALNANGTRDESESMDSIAGLERSWVKQLSSKLDFLGYRNCTVF